MSIATQIERLQEAKSDLAVSITNKGVPVPQSTKLDGYAALVDQIEQGSGSNEKDVTFIDVDGNIVKSYYLNEVGSISALPAMPVHQGLTPVAWSKTLNQVKALTVPEYIYPRYTVTDDKLHIIFEIPQGGADIELQNLYVAMKTPWDSTQNAPVSDRRNVIVNWGDGSGDIEKQYYWSGGSGFTMFDEDNNFSLQRLHVYGSAPLNTSSIVTALGDNHYKPAYSHHYSSAGTYDFVISCVPASNETYDFPYVFIPSSDSIVKDNWKCVKAIYLPQTFGYNQCIQGTTSSDSDYYPLRTKDDGYVVVDDNWEAQVFDFKDSYMHIGEDSNASLGDVYYRSLFRGAKIYGINLNNGSTYSANPGTSNSVYTTKHFVGRKDDFKDSTLKAIYVPNNKKICVHTQNMFDGTNLRNISSISVKYYKEVSASNSVSTSSLSHIGASAFYNTYKLANVSVDNGVTQIRSLAFAVDNENNALERTINLPSTITSINATAFNNVYKTKVYLRATTPPTLTGNTDTKAIFYVPNSALNTYKNAENWSMVNAEGRLNGYNF